jgi:hypothetical protein
VDHAAVAELRNDVQVDAADATQERCGEMDIDQRERGVVRMRDDFDHDTGVSGRDRRCREHDQLSIRCTHPLRTGRKDDLVGAARTRLDRALLGDVAID